MKIREIKGEILDTNTTTIAALVHKGYTKMFAVELMERIKKGEFKSNMIEVTRWEKILRLLHLQI